jgi:alkylation response protein AidB-like acyl-CoA dehydrogenase
MDQTVAPDPVLPGDEERAMLRDAVRGLLDDAWPAAGAVERAADPEAVAAVWRVLAAQGLAALGTDPAEGGVREIGVVMEALGAAGCPAPMLGAALTNLALAGAGAPPADLLDALNRGEARVALAFGPLDPDPGAGRLERTPAGFDGTLRFVEGAVGATHLVAALDEGTLALLDLAAPGVTVTPTRALGTAGLAEVAYRDAPARAVAVPPPRLRDLLAVARLLVAIRAHGAARRAFDMAVAYAKERRQFGQPIGRFQAIQHKLANVLIALEGVRLTCAHAAARHDLGDPDWRYFAAAASAHASPALRQASLETHHAFGAIGYAEEHEAPRHFRRVHLDAAALGGWREARREVAAHLLDGGGRPLPEYDLGPEGNAFREEVRGWLRAHWPEERRAEYEARDYHDREYHLGFARDLGETGWLGLGWPREFGGGGRSPMEAVAFVEAMERADAPRTGVPIQASALMLFGTPAQQERYLPEILRGEAMHGMGYSEPDSGSDLASLRTTAVRDGDEWVINGQKIWTTTYWGQYLFVAARTDRDAKPPHAGISMFIVPTDAKGLTIRPMRTMYDGRFANCFYDDVRVPADALVGEVNGGWKVLTSALATERGIIGAIITMKVVRLFELLCGHVRSAGLHGDAVVRDRVAALASEIEVSRQLAHHCAALATADGLTPPEWGAISKVYSGELLERFGEAALDILGMRAALSQGAPGALENGRFEQSLRHSLMWVISIGTNEIQRSLIAQRGLDLPR